MRSLVIKQWQLKYDDFLLRCFWYPGLHLAEPDLDRLTASLETVNKAEPRLNYGFFSESADSNYRRNFLNRTIWCVMEKAGEPVGLVYMFDLGEFNSRKVIHFGLTKFTQHLGKHCIPYPYAALGLGNVLNFGPHYATNVTHIPVVVDLFGNIAYDTFPDYRQQCTDLRNEYLPIVSLLTREYLVPVLNYNPKDFCSRTFRVKNALANDRMGFENRWDLVPKSDQTLCNLFVKDWLNVKRGPEDTLHIVDDLVQVGKIDCRYLSHPLNLNVLNRAVISIAEDEPQTGHRLKLVKNAA